jgi:hypothetical protein
VNISVKKSLVFHNVAGSTTDCVQAAHAQNNREIDCRNRGIYSREQGNYSRRTGKQLAAAQPRL